MNLLGLPPYQKGQRKRKRRSKAEIEDEAFRSWIARQPSCLTGMFTECVEGELLNVACHVRRSANSGTAYKPLLSCVPLRDCEHKLQHSQGELASLRAYLPHDQFALILAADDQVQAAKEWFTDQARVNVARWKAER